MLLGLVGETGLVGVGSFVRPRPVYSVVPFAVPFVVCPSTSALSVTTDKLSASGFGIGVGAFSSIGDSGGGGISVPAVSDASGAKTGSSNRRAEELVPFDTAVDGIMIYNVQFVENATVYDLTELK
jgi:hypothetical protein